VVGRFAAGCLLGAWLRFAEGRCAAGGAGGSVATFWDEALAVADETRRQRRDARRAADDQPMSEPSGAPRPAAAGGASVAPIERESRRRGGFLRESWAELHKVDWPNRAQVIQGTVAVIVAVIIVGAFLWGVDQLLRPFVRNVLLGQ